MYCLLHETTMTAADLAANGCRDSVKQYLHGRRRVCRYLVEDGQDYEDALAKVRWEKKQAQLLYDRQLRT